MLGEVPHDLVALGGHPRVSARRLGLDGAARRQRAGQRLRLPPLELVGDKQAAVGDAGAAIGGVHDAAHMRLELVADLVEQSGERTPLRAGRSPVAEQPRRTHRPRGSVPSG